MTMKYQISFEYKQIGDDGKPLRSRGTQARLSVEVSSLGIYSVSSVGDKYRGRGENVKDAILVARHDAKYERNKIGKLLC